MRQSIKPFHPSDTIDVGIDLGTTTSLIAVLQQGVPTLVPNSFGKVITPSCVGLDASGNLVVGEKAYNGASEFKRLMGTTERHPLTKLTALEMSALVLKSLKRDVYEHLGFDPTSAVITVPALFEFSQLEATHQAAESAGFEQVVLLQEPIAASIAAGIHEEGYFLAYDLGGGTFDVSLLLSKNKIFRVVDHDGDNFLGGRDCDLKIVDWIAENLPFPQFHRHQPQYRFDFAFLKEIAIRAKLELTTRPQTMIEIERLPSFPSMQKIHLELSRNQFELLIRPEIEKTLQICERMLKKNKLQASDLNYVLLIGGGTLMPLVSQRLQETFPIRLKKDQDPITLVALGACLFSGSEKKKNRVQSQEYFRLEYERLTQTETVVVVGQWMTTPVPEYRYQLLEEGFSERSSLVLDEKNRFMKRLKLPQEGENNFEIYIYNEQQQEIGRQAFRVLRGQKISAPPLSRTLGVWLADNRVAIYLEKGTPLPARKTQSHRTARSIYPGDLAAVFEIKVVQGENTRANRNRLAGKIRVPGIQLKKMLPENTEVLVTITVDRSGVVRAKAYVPLLEQEFESVITLAMNVPEMKDLQEDLEQQQRRLIALENLLKQRLSQEQLQLRAIEKEIQMAAAGDLDAGLKAKRLLLDLMIHLDELESNAEWPQTLAEYQEMTQEIQKILSEQEASHYQLLCQEIEESIQSRNMDRFQRKLDLLAKLKWDLLARSPEFWEQLFRQIRLNPDWITDRKKGTLLLDQGEFFLKQGSIAELIEVTKQLWQLVPKYSSRWNADLR